MAIRLIESYEDSDAIVTVAGRTFPATCLVEDTDGLRMLLVPSLGEVPIQVWARAHAGGAVALVAPDGPQSWQCVQAERFMDARTENLMDRTFRYTGLAGIYGELPDVRAMFAAKNAPMRSTGFVHLHLHTEYSALDGLSTVDEALEQIVAQGQGAGAQTDHGTCAGHLEWADQAAKAGIKPLFGMEAYFIDGDRFERPPTKPSAASFTKCRPDGKEVPDEDAYRAAMDAHSSIVKRLQYGYFHLILLAQSEVGLHNLWALSTMAYRDGMYYRPRLDWDALERFNEGVLATTACLRGPLADPLLLGDEALARDRLGRLLNIFGERLWLEIQPNNLDEQKRLNQALVSMGTAYGVPLLAAVDSHYPTAEDQPAHKAWIAVQTASDVQDEGDLFAGDLSLYVQGEADVRRSLSYLGSSVVDQSIEQTARIAEMCTASIESKKATPIFSRKGPADPEITGEEAIAQFLHAKDATRLLETCLDNWHRCEGKGYADEVAMARFEKEMNLLIDKQFCGYFLMVQDYVLAAKEGRATPDGRKILVGPGRGSGGGSLVAYLARITELDPVEGDLLFERFLTEGRTELPDFDIDFPQTEKATMLAYVQRRWGAEHVAIVGSHIRLQNKGIVRDLGRAMASVLPDGAYMDLNAVAKIIEEAEASTAGLGLSWEELWVQEEERLAPYLEKYPTLFEMGGRLVERLKTYGKHAAGVVISPDINLNETFPLRGGEDDNNLITQFDMNSLERLGLVKFDLLNVRTLDTIQRAVDLIREQTGIEVDVYNWKEEYRDPQVWSEIAAGNTLGIFQIETNAGTRLTKQFGPATISELADVITLVRPGPSRSGLKDMYLARRAGTEEVSFPDPRLETVLAKTYGCMLYQEDIMATCMVLAGYNSSEADKVRKILGKKQVEKVKAAGEEFISRCITHGMDETSAASLWAQMAEFAKYSFNRAHAYAYAIVGYWCAWLKFHFPVQFLCAALSTIEKDRIPDFVTEARRMGYRVLPPDINESGTKFTAAPLTVRYGFSSVKGIGPAAAAALVENQPYADWDDFMARKGSAVNEGVVLLLAQIGAFDSMVPNRRGLESVLLGNKSGSSARCIFKDETIKLGEQELPCRFDWDSEPVQIGRTGKPLKRKPIPKRCTKACRQYSPPPPVAIEEIEPYTDADIRDIEQQLLKIYLSSTPFDAIDPEDRKVLYQQAEILLDDGAPQGIYLVGGILRKVRPHRDKTGNQMAFLGLSTEISELDIVCFSRDYERFRSELKVDTLGIAEIHKNDRGYSLVSFMAISQPRGH